MQIVRDLIIIDMKVLSLWPSLQHEVRETERGIFGLFAAFRWWSCDVLDPGEAPEPVPCHSEEVCHLNNRWDGNKQREDLKKYQTHNRYLVCAKVPVQN